MAKRGKHWAPKGWSATRLAVLERDGWTCQLRRQFVCLDPRPGGLRGLGKRQVHVDHKRPRHLGGGHHMSNLRAVCVECHKTLRTADAPPSRQWT